MNQQQSIRSLLLLGLTLAVACVSFSQNQQRVDPVEFKGYREFNDENASYRSDLTLFFNDPDVRNQFNLREIDQFVVAKNFVDNLGVQHIMFRQHYKGTPVEGATYLLHKRPNGQIYGSGTIVSGIQVYTTPISLKQATTNAVKVSKMRMYGNKEVNQNQLNPVLVILKSRKQPRGYHLAWKLEIMEQSSPHNERIYINAQNGELLKRSPMAHDILTQANTIYYGTRNIETDQNLLDNTFFLFDPERGHGIRTQRLNALLAEEPIIDPDGDNIWNGNNEVGASAHWVCEMAYDYFDNAHQLAGFDGLGTEPVGRTLNVFIDMNDLGADNAFWDGVSLNFGSGFGGNSIGPPVVLDVAGHEYTHAVIDHSTMEGLDYELESGALNESFADIFGAMIEFSVPSTNGNTHDWLIGEDYLSNVSLWRSMANPSGLGQPDTYGGDFWFDVVDCVPVGDINDKDYNDVCGVHTNSGVQNLWFYLLSEGGSGVNDNGDAYVVQGIGRDAAAQVAFRNLTTQLTGNATYADARTGSITAATELFGDCSFELLQVILAWNAVGVNSNTTLGYDVTTNCTILNTFHQGGFFGATYIAPQPYYLKAINNLQSSCDIASNGQLVAFEAGNRIRFAPGFASGDRLMATIDPCITASLRPANSDDDNTSTDEHDHSSENDENESNEIDAATVRLYPNPSTTGLFTLQISVEENTSTIIQVLDTYGKVIKQQSVNTSSSTIDLRAFSKGVYLVKIATSNYTRVEKIVYQ